MSSLSNHKRLSMVFLKIRLYYSCYFRVSVSPSKLMYIWLHCEKVQEVTEKYPIKRVSNIYWIWALSTNSVPNKIIGFHLYKSSDHVGFSRRIHLYEKFIDTLICCFFLIWRSLCWYNNNLVGHHWNPSNWIKAGFIFSM